MSSLVKKFLFLTLISTSIFLDPDVGIAEDIDRDGIDDDFEHVLAKSFLPRIWYHGEEDCPEPGLLLYHVRPLIPGRPKEEGIAITYAMYYEDDCGTFGHPNDTEAFAITLYPDDSPSGFGVYSLLTAAHLWTDCQSYYPNRRYDDLAPDRGYQEGVQTRFWGDIWISKNKHGTFDDPGDICDGACFWADECDSGKLMNINEPGLLVDSSQGQLFYMANIGEINDHIIDNTNEIEGFEDWGRYVWSGFSTYQHYLTATARDYISSYVKVNYLYPNPLRMREDFSINFDLHERSIVWVELWNVDPDSYSDIEDVSFLGEMCPESGIDARAWDGMVGSEGLPWGCYLLQARARRGDRSAFYNAEDNKPCINKAAITKTNSPTNLTQSLIEGGVELTWYDNANDELFFFVERKDETDDGVFTCAYKHIAQVSALPGTGYQSHSVYGLPCGKEYVFRVKAIGDGGHSGYSNQVSATGEDIPDITDLMVVGSHLEQEHDHYISWNFDYPFGPGFTNYVVEYKYKNPYEMGPDYNWSAWLLVEEISDQWRQYTTHNNTNKNYCYKYRVTANVLEFGCGSTSESVSVDHGHDCGSTPPDDTECPIVWPFTGQFFSRDNNVLAFSELRGGFGIDYYPLQRTPILKGNKYLLMVREDRDDLSYFDFVKLIAIDHPESLNVDITQNGRAFGYTEIAPPIAVVDSLGEDKLAALVDYGNGQVEGAIGDYLIVDFGETGGTVLALSMVNPADPVKAPGPKVLFDNQTILGDEPNWIEVETILPRGRGGTRFVDLAPYYSGSGSLKIKLSFLSSQIVDIVGIVQEESSNFQLQNLTLQNAIHSESGSIKDELLYKDEQYGELIPGEDIMLVFSGIEGFEPKKFVLVSGGYYIPY